MIRNCLHCLLIPLVILLAAPVHAATSSGAGSTGAAFLEIGAGGRSAAMGEAGVAWSDDVYGMYFNPAGIADVRRQEVGFTHNTLFLDLDYDYIAYVHPLRVGTLGFAGTYVDLGGVDRREVGVGGNPTGSLGSATGYDLAFSLTYARAFSRVLDLGVTAKIINETLDNKGAAAFAVDLGAKWRAPIDGLTLGLSLSNLGTSLQFIQGKDELPITARLGAGYRSLNKRWGLVGDVAWVKNQDIEAKLGGEYWVLADRFALRAGVNSANDAGSGFTVGTGVKWNDILFDYAYVSTGDLGAQNNISLAYQFGPVHEREERATWRAEREPVRSAPVEVQAEAWGATALPFVYRSDEPGHEWIGAATSEVLNDDWQRRGARNSSKTSALYVIDGDYWVIDGMISISAKITTRTGTVIRTSVSGDVAEPFAVWQMLRMKINQRLAAEGMTGLNLAPAAIPAPARVVTPLPVIVPAPPPPIRRDGRSVAISIRPYGVAEASSASMELSRAVERAIADLGLSTDIATSTYRLESQFAEMGDGSAVLYGRVIDRATGIPIGNIEVYGSMANMAAFAARIADAVVFKIPR